MMTTFAEGMHVSIRSISRKVLSYTIECVCMNWNASNGEQHAVMNAYERFRMSKIVYAGLKVCASTSDINSVNVQTAMIIPKLTAGRKTILPCMQHLLGISMHLEGPCNDAYHTCNSRMGLLNRDELCKSIIIETRTSVHRVRLDML